MNKHLRGILARLGGPSAFANTGDYWALRETELTAAGEPQAALLLLYGPIGGAWYDEESVSAGDLVRELDALGGQDLTVRINSGGGSVTDGIAIANALRGYPGTVTMQIDSLCASIATVIAVAGDLVEMADNATWMVHAPWGGCLGNANDMREMADVLDHMADTMVASYTRREGIDADTIGALLADGKDHYYTAEQAEAAGFIDAVVDPAAAAGTDDLAASQACKVAGISQLAGRADAPAGPVPTLPRAPMPGAARLAPAFAAFRPSAGRRLPGLLNTAIDAAVAADDSRTRPSIVAAMAVEAGVGLPIVQDLLAGRPVSADLSRLQGFSRVPGLPTAEAIAQAHRADATPGTRQTHAQPHGDHAMNWKTVALALGIALESNATNTAARTAIVGHLELTGEPSDTDIHAAVEQAMAARARGSASAPASADVQAAAREAVAAENTRQATIRQHFAAWNARGIEGVARLQDECLADMDCTAEAASTRLLALMGSQATPLGGDAHVSAGADAIDKRRDGMSAALLARGNIRLDPESQQPLADGANPYRGNSLLDMARECIRASGGNPQGMGREEVAEAALGISNIRAAGMQTTSDFPVLLENTLHKMVLTGFNQIPPTWSTFCSSADVSDYREWNRLVPGIIANLEPVNEKGEYQNKPIPDATGLPQQVKRRGNIVAITPEVIVNDDLAQIVAMAVAFGQGGNRSIERAVYALLAQNGGAGPTLKDSNPLFHASRGNLAAQAESPTVNSLFAAATAMTEQKFPGKDKEFMDIMPDVAVAKHTTAGDIRVVVNSTYDPDATNKLQRANKASGIVREVVGSPRVASANGWYLFANPQMAPCIEVAFLDGQRTPRVTQDEHFRSGGLQWRVELPFGVAPISVHGGYYNPGA